MIGLLLAEFIGVDLGLATLDMGRAGEFESVWRFVDGTLSSTSESPARGTDTLVRSNFLCSFLGR